jgi:hypothetical protein
MGDRHDSVVASIEETGSAWNSKAANKARKTRLQQAGGEVFALDYGRLMGDPICLVALFSSFLLDE